MRRLTLKLFASTILALLFVACGVEYDPDTEKGSSESTNTYSTYNAYAGDDTAKIVGDAMVEQSDRHVAEMSAQYDLEFAQSVAESNALADDQAAYDLYQESYVDPYTDY